MLFYRNKFDVCDDDDECVDVELFLCLWLCSKKSYFLFDFHLLDDF